MCESFRTVKNQVEPYTNAACCTDTELSKKAVEKPYGELPELFLYINNLLGYEEDIVKGFLELLHKLDCESFYQMEKELAEWTESFTTKSGSSGLLGEAKAIVERLKRSNHILGYMFEHFNRII